MSEGPAGSRRRGPRSRGPRRVDARGGDGGGLGRAPAALPARGGERGAERPRDGGGGGGRRYVVDAVRYVGLEVPSFHTRLATVFFFHTGIFTVIELLNRVRIRLLQNPIRFRLG